MSRRIVVLGGTGFFGASIVELLRGECTVASRRTGVDVRDAASLRAFLRAGDVVIDAAGPFQERGTEFVAAACDVGADVLDLSDSLAYAERVVAMEERIARAGIRVLTSCSSVSAIDAAFVRLSGIARPERVRAFLAPASRRAGRGAVLASFFASLGRDVRVRRGGTLVSVPAWSESRAFAMPAPVGPVCGGLMETADALLLPRAWPSLRDVEFYVDPRVPLWAVRLPGARALSWLGRIFGRVDGGVAAEIDGVRCSLVAGDGAHRIAVAPAVLAARSIAEGRFEARGLVAADRCVDADELVRFCESLGATFQREPPEPGRPG
jgi:hypothetical protein